MFKHSQNEQEGLMWSTGAEMVYIAEQGADVRGTCDGRRRKRRCYVKRASRLCSAFQVAFAPPQLVMPGVKFHRLGVASAACNGMAGDACIRLAADVQRMLHCTEFRVVEQ